MTILLSDLLLAELYSIPRPLVLKADSWMDWLVPAALAAAGSWLVVFGTDFARERSQRKNLKAMISLEVESILERLHTQQAAEEYNRDPAANKDAPQPKKPLRIPSLNESHTRVFRAHVAGLTGLGEAGRSTLIFYQLVEGFLESKKREYELTDAYNARENKSRFGVDAINLYSVREVVNTQRILILSQGVDVLLKLNPNYTVKPSALVKPIPFPPAPTKDSAQPGSGGSGGGEPPAS